MKIISEAKIEEYKYRVNVIREMAVLKVLVHPNLCRMVSAFRYRGSAYLVLEYASNGDLHSCVVNGNKLNHLQTRLLLLSLCFINSNILITVLFLEKSN